MGSLNGYTSRVERLERLGPADEPFTICVCIRGRCSRPNATMHVRLAIVDSAGIPPEAPSGDADEP